MSWFSGINSKTKKNIYLSVFLLWAVGAAVIFSAMAAERSGMYWIGLDPDFSKGKVIDDRGFLMVDVSDLSSNSGSGEESEPETEVVPIGIGPLPSVPTLTAEELKLYGVLSRGDGLILSEDKESLAEDIHWQEVILEKGDTLQSTAKEYGVSVQDIRRANDLKPNESPDQTDILYVPDSTEYVSQTLAFVNKLKRAELDLKKQGKPLSTVYYVVRQGDSLWSISSQFDRDLDTIIGSNELGNINLLKPGTKLRIPNQDGIFVKTTKKDTIAKLAGKYGSFKESVYVANNLKPNSKLMAGMEIFLPGAKYVEGSEGGTRNIARNARNTITRASRNFRWPVMGKISSVFGWRRSPFGRRRVFHAGIDIRAPRGRGIVAAGDGRVVHSGWMGGYGRTIVISHPGGLVTLYGHCSSLLVRNGVIVHSGQLIGRVGSTGRSTGNHLHFEVRRNGTPVNALRYLR